MYSSIMQNVSPVRVPLLPRRLTKDGFLTYLQQKNSTFSLSPKTNHSIELQSFFSDIRLIKFRDMKHIQLSMTIRMQIF